MYPKLGFKKINDTLFEADLDEQSFEHPVHIKLAAESFLPLP